MGQKNRLLSPPKFASGMYTTHITVVGRTSGVTGEIHTLRDNLLYDWGCFSVCSVFWPTSHQVTKNGRNKEEAIGEILRRIQIVFNGQLVKDVSKIFLCINLLQSYILCIFRI